MSRKIKFEMELTLRNKPMGRGAHHYKNSYKDLTELIEDGTDIDVIYQFLQDTINNDLTCAYLDQSEVLSINGVDMDTIIKNLKEDE